jgi:hypothetical protein
MREYAKLWVGIAIGFAVCCMTTFLEPFHLRGVIEALKDNNMAYYNKAGNFVLNRPTPLVCNNLSVVNNEIISNEVEVTNWSLTDQKVIRDNETKSLYSFEGCKISKTK